MFYMRIQYIIYGGALSIVFGLFSYFMGTLMPEAFFNIAGGLFYPVTLPGMILGVVFGFYIAKNADENNRIKKAQLIWSDEFLKNNKKTNLNKVSIMKYLKF